jgi:hypothetical protein
MLTILRKVVMSFREGAIEVLYHFRYFEPRENRRLCERSVISHHDPKLVKS